MCVTFLKNILLWSNFFESEALKAKETEEVFILVSIHIVLPDLIKTWLYGVVVTTTEQLH